MRSLAVLAIIVTCAAATAAGAETLNGKASSNAKSEAMSYLAMLTGSDAPVSPSSGGDPLSRQLERDIYEAGAGPVRGSSSLTLLSTNTALRVNLAGVLRALDHLTFNLAQAQEDMQASEVALTHDWPAAMAFGTQHFGVDLTPHAGVGVTNFGGSAEAGATLRLMSRDAATAERLRARGLRDGLSFGDKGRWYLFAAASGRAVGLNMLHGERGWNRAGWTTDATSTLAGDAQVGVGWRKGDMQTSFGYIHRELKGQNTLLGVEARQDSVVAFSLSIRPQF